MNTEATEAKPCTRCGAIKPMADFYRAGGTRTGYQGQCKVCMRRYCRTRYQREREVLLDRMRNWRNSDPEYFLLFWAKQRAKQQGLSFDLSKDDIKIPEFCPVFPWLRLKTGVGKKCHESASVDRIDPNRGYVKDNVRVISNRANSLKSNATIEELRALVNDAESRQN